MSQDLKTLIRGIEAWLNGSALPLWQTRGVDHVNGGFIEYLDDAGEPISGPKRPYPQARQIYVYAQAGLMGWDGPWREMIEQALDFFLRVFPRDDGLMRLRVGADGAPQDETPRLYDQAFSLLLLATAHQVLPERGDIVGHAVRLRDRLLSDRRAPAGGFIEVVGRPYYANPNMHLLEATLAWAEISDDPAWTAIADEIAELAMAKFIDAKGGFLREYFDETWSPTNDDDARLIEPGHQFEWAWLLLWWSRVRGRNDAVAVAKRLYEVGRMGVDEARSVAFNALWDDLTPRDTNARLWPQTEWAKAAVALARLEQPGSARQAELLEDAAMSVRGLNKYLQMPTPGLWRDRYLADGSFVDEPAPATSFYHIVCAITELRTVT